MMNLTNTEYKIVEENKNGILIKIKKEAFWYSKSNIKVDELFIKKYKRFIEKNSEDTVGAA